jgi:ribosomal protein S18
MFRSHLLKRLPTIGNLKLPKSPSQIPTYSDTTAFLDPDNDFNNVLFKPKQTYSPRDLNAKNAQWVLKKKHQEKVDILEEFRIDPLKDYKNVRMLSHFVTEMGFIKPRVETGLSMQNQKKVAKAIRRARAMGKKQILKVRVDAVHIQIESRK